MKIICDLIEGVRVVVIDWVVFWCQGTMVLYCYCWWSMYMGSSSIIFCFLTPQADQPDKTPKTKNLSDVLVAILSYLNLLLLLSCIGGI